MGSLDRRCRESPIDDFAAHYDELYASHKLRLYVAYQTYAAELALGVTANVIEGEEFDTDSDPGDEA